MRLLLTLTGYCRFWYDTKCKGRGEEIVFFINKINKFSKRMSLEQHKPTPAEAKKIREMMTPDMEAMSVEREKEIEFRDWSQMAIQNIVENTQKTKVLVDDAEIVRATIEDYAKKFPDGRFGLSRDLTLRKNVKVKAPLTSGWPNELQGFSEKYDLYVEANDLDTKNMHAQFYIKYLNGDAIEPYAWVMNYGLKMPVFTEKEYEDAAAQYDIHSVTVEPPSKDEMLNVLRELGYADEITK